MEKLKPYENHIVSSYSVYGFLNVFKNDDQDFLNAC